MKNTSTACFLLGSNLGNRMEYLRQATEALSLQLGPITGISGVYSSPSWGYTSERNFLNQAVLIETCINPMEILERIRVIETNLGRIRSGREYTDRTIDIDILFYGHEIVDKPGLTIPHPRMHLRRFVLVPLEEIASCWEHPLLKKKVTDMLTECPDVSEVVPWAGISQA